MLHTAECQILPNQGATLADRQALKPSLNEILHVNYLLLLCPRPKDNAHFGARMGFLDCTPVCRKERPSVTAKWGLVTCHVPFYQRPNFI